MTWIYLDNNATTMPAPQVMQAVQQAQEQWWANPSSVHRLGQMVRQQVELARAQVAQLIGCKDRELVFTSGGTESNNLALSGVLGSGDRLITTRIEHAAIREPVQALAGQKIEIVYCPVDLQGQVDPADLQRILDQPPSHPQATTLVSIQWANNETGVIQPIAELARIVEQFRQSSTPPKRVLLHVDATQAVGKIPVDLGQVTVDFLTMSAHKFHGPKGVGALYVRSGRRLKPQLLGGPQERQRRGGTENTTGIIGMGVAAQLAREFLADTPTIARLTALRDQFEKGLLDLIHPGIPGAGGSPGSNVQSPKSNVLGEIPGVVVNSGMAKARLWNTTNVGFARLEAEAILLALSEQGVCASAGAACSSGSLEPSPVLLAMGVPEVMAHGSVRFSISRFTTPEEVALALERVRRVVGKLAGVLPM